MNYCGGISAGTWDKDTVSSPLRGWHGGQCPRRCVHVRMYGIFRYAGSFTGIIEPSVSDTKATEQLESMPNTYQK